MWDHPVCKPLPCLVLQPPPFLESCPPSCPSPSLILVWMNVSSLTPWLSDFHIVWFSISSGCFFVSKFAVVLFFGYVRRHSVSTYASIWPEVVVYFYKINLRTSFIFGVADGIFQTWLYQYTPQQILFFGKVGDIFPLCHEVSAPFSRNWEGLW